jgi:competence protein ComK
MMMIEFEKHYIINQYMMYLEEFYNQVGKLCTKVSELGRTIFVDKSPREILNDSIRCIGFDLRGAISTSKWILGGETYLCPFMVNPILKICVFPHRSQEQGITRWFNPIHIKRTGSINRKTNVEFHNGQTLLVHSKLSAFNNKLQIADQLSEISVEFAKHPENFIIDPGKEKLQFKRKDIDSKCIK